MSGMEIIALIGAAKAIVELIGKHVQTAKQDHELTPEEEATVDAAWADLVKQDHWQKRPDPPTPG